MNISNVQEKKSHTHVKVLVLSVTFQAEEADVLVVKLHPDMGGGPLIHHGSGSSRRAVAKVTYFLSSLRVRCRHSYYRFSLFGTLFWGTRGREIDQGIEPQPSGFYMVKLHRNWLPCRVRRGYAVVRGECTLSCTRSSPLRIFRFAAIIAKSCV